MHDDLGNRRMGGRHRIGGSVGRYGLLGAAAVFAAVVFYYLIGAALVHKVDDDLGFKDAAWRDVRAMDRAPLG